jgi:hypothetical protein
MRKSVLAAAGLALLAAVFWNSAPAQAMPLSAPAALKSAADQLTLTDKIWCGDGCGGGYYYRPYYRPYWRPYYRPYYGYYRPYRPYYGYYRPWYRPYYGYGYHRPWYRPYYGYGYGYGPRPRYYVGSRIYWY